MKTHPTLTCKLGVLVLEALKKKLRANGLNYLFKKTEGNARKKIALNDQSKSLELFLIIRMLKVSLIY